MRFDLRIPCKNCPFANRDTRIKFACRERAEEIEELAYRQGFPCHLSAVERDEVIDGDEETFFDFGENTQHCVGAIGMFLNDGYDTWPGIDNDEDLCEQDYSEAQRIAFEDCETFLAANEGGNR